MKEKEQWRELINAGYWLAMGIWGTIIFRAAIPNTLKTWLAVVILSGIMAVGGWFSVGIALGILIITYLGIGG